MTFRGGLSKCALYAFDQLSRRVWTEAVILRVDAGKYYTVMDDTEAGRFSDKVDAHKARIVFFGTLKELRSLLKQPIPTLFDGDTNAT
ncbi:MAG: hypothetical protein KAR39_12410 [Thermoplasmata archaeon]|nr:hypothetical protein [Thermoplasmata archaeon]